MKKNLDKIQKGSYSLQRRVLPDFPKTRHLYLSPNRHDDDEIASVQDCDVIFCAGLDQSSNRTDEQIKAQRQLVEAWRFGNRLSEARIFVEEKIDGANCGMAWLDGHPVLRNRDKILNKAYTKNTPAKRQFRPAWNWLYENRPKFEKLYELIGGVVGVFGEWLYACHTLYYNLLPDYFIAYDIYDPELGGYIATHKTRELLTAAGFCIPELVKAGPFGLTREVESASLFKTDLNDVKPPLTMAYAEGIYIKITDGVRVVERFKKVRSDFHPPTDWNEHDLIKNKLATDSRTPEELDPDDF